MKRIEMKVNHVKHNTENYIADYLATLGIKPEDVDSLQYNFLYCVLRD